MRFTVCLSFVFIISMQIISARSVKEMKDVEYTETVKSSTGEVKIETIKLKQGQQIINDTKKIIEIKFGKEGKYGYGKLMPQSNLKLYDKKEQKKLNLNLSLIGSARFKFKKIKKDQYRIKTPVAVAGVRGTAFSIENKMIKLPEGVLSIVPLDKDGNELTNNLIELKNNNQVSIKDEKAVVEKLVDGKKEWALIAPRDVFPPIIGECQYIKKSAVKNPDETGLIDWQGVTKKGKGININGFFIAKKETTVKQYNVFLEWHKLTNSHDFCHPNEPKDFKHHIDGDLKEDESIKYISWYDGYACANYYGGRLPYFIEAKKAESKMMCFTNSIRELNYTKGGKELNKKIWTTLNTNVSYNKILKKIRDGIYEQLEDRVRRGSGLPLNNKGYASQDLRVWPSFRIVYDKKPPKQSRRVYRD